MVFNQTNCSNKDYALIQRFKKNTKQAISSQDDTIKRRGTWNYQLRQELLVESRRVSSYNSQLPQVHNDASPGEPEYFISSHQSQSGGWPGTMATHKECVTCGVTAALCVFTSRIFSMKWTLRPCGQMTASCFWDAAAPAMTEQAKPAKLGSWIDVILDKTKRRRKVCLICS